MVECTCDICSKKFERRYNIEITREDSEYKSLINLIYHFEICQECFLIIEANINRMQKITRLRR